MSDLVPMFATGTEPLTVDALREVLRSHVTGPTPEPWVMVMPARQTRQVDRLRVRWGFMPFTREGAKYAARRRRMARKRKRGWA